MAMVTLEKSPSSSSPSPSCSHFSKSRHYYLAVDRPQFKMLTLLDLLRMARKHSSLPIVLCCSSRDELDAVCAAVSNLPNISLDSLGINLLNHKGYLASVHATWEMLNSYANVVQKFSIVSGLKEPKLVFRVSGCLNQKPPELRLLPPVSTYGYLIQFFGPLYSDLADDERILKLDKFRQATVKLNHKFAADAEVNHETGNEEHELFMIVVTDACLPHVSLGESSICAHVLINHDLPAKKDTYLRRMTTCLAADGIVINLVAGAGEVMTLQNIDKSVGVVIEEMPINMFEML